MLLATKLLNMLSRH